MKEIVVAWILSLIVSFAPPAKVASGPQFEGWEETADEKLVRYEAIATDLYETVFENPDNASLFSGGFKGKLRTTTLLLATAAHESAFSRDVDQGPCFRKNGYKGRCDSGKAYCMMQVHVGPDGKTPEGWTGEELFADRKKCFTTALNGMRRSIRACRKVHKTPNLWLSAYASGDCERGGKGAEELWRMYESFWGKKTPPKEPTTAPPKKADS